MNRGLLIDHFDRISTAPNAIPRLRSFILDLAVRGKLSSQEISDEPASELLKQIKVERARLNKERKIRTERPSPPPRNDELPYPNPAGWVWVRLGEITRRIHYGFTASANPALTDVRLLRITDIQDNAVDWSSVPGVDISKREIEQYRLEKGDILVARTGGTIGKTFLVDHLPVTAVFASYLIRIQGATALFDRYLKLFLESPVYWKQLEKGARGGGQPNVNGKTLGRMVVAVPPAAEQQRIVARVDELMDLCDRFEASRREQEERRERVSVSALHHLSNGSSSDSFQHSSTFYLEHLADFTARPSQIPGLRRAILSLAIRGRLVAQNANDDPAAGLLQQRQLTLDADSEPWTLPPGWAWSSFDLIGETLGGGTPSKADSELWAGAIPWVSPKDMKVDSIGDAQDHISEQALERSAARLVPPGSLLMVVRGMILAHSFPTALTEVPLAINQDMKAIVPFNSELARFLLLLTRGLKPEVLRLVRRSTHGTCKLLTDDLFSLPIPIPPLAEQSRILTKVRQLMDLCDHLEGQLTSMSEEASHLLESVLQHALSPGEIERPVPQVEAHA